LSGKKEICVNALPTVAAKVIAARLFRIISKVRCSVISVAIGTTETHAHTKNSWHNNVHDEKIVMATG
jgi:hypothetical protein